MILQKFLVLLTIKLNRRFYDSDMHKLFYGFKISIPENYQPKFLKTMKFKLYHNIPFSTELHNDMCKVGISGMINKLSYERLYKKMNDKEKSLFNKFIDIYDWGYKDFER